MIAKKAVEEEKTNIKDFFYQAGVPLRIRRNTFLFNQLDKADSLYFVSSGKFVVSRETNEGKQFYLSIIQSGQLLGDLSLFDHSSVQCFSAKAIENSEVYIVEKKQIEKIFFEEKELSMELMKIYNLYNKTNETKFRDLVLNSKKGALFSTLIRLANTYGVEKGDGILIDLKLTFNDIASFCATTREGANRIFSELKRDDIIDVAEGKILIMDLEYLREEIGCDLCPIQYCKL